MFNPTVFENSPPASIAVLVVNADGIDVVGESIRRFVPLKRSHLHGVIIGPLADLRLRQTFGYSSEVSQETLEAIYRFPLPGDAAVTNVIVRFGDVEIRAGLEERSAAERAYADAKRQGKQAALATREGPDVFTLQVSGIQPDQEVVIETSYVQLARAEGLSWMLRAPLTTAPRFVRQDEAGSGAEKRQPLLLMRDPGHRFSLDLLVQGAGEARSPTHGLDVRQEGDALRVRLAQGEVIPDRDFVLAWTPQQATDRPTSRVVLHDDAVQGFTYFLAHVAPPSAPGESGAAREVVLLVDHSGSMTGPKWDAADWAVDRFLSDLTPQDAFALAWFHNHTAWFEPAVRPADPGRIQAALDWIKRSRDSGGTELGVALEQALHLMPAPGNMARHALVITDAEVTDEGRILRLVDEEARKPLRRRVSVLCIDAAPNAYLAQEMAERGGGVAKFLTSQPEAEDITTALEQTLADWSQPVLINLRLCVNRPHVEMGRGPATPGVETGWSAMDLGDLPGGRAVWVIGRAPHGEGALAFRVQTDDDSAIAAEMSATAASATPALKALFGARRIAALEHLINARYDQAQLADQLLRLGYDPAQVLAGGGQNRLYSENQRAENDKALHGLLVQESLAYGLASSAVGFVAVRQEAGKVVERSVAVANALPAGWSDQFLGASAPPTVGMMQFRKYSGGMPAPAVASFAPPLGGVFAMHESAPASLPVPAGSFDIPFTKEALSGATIFTGTPHLVNGRAVLYDSTAGRDTLPEKVAFSALTLRLPGKGAAVDVNVQLLIYVGDAVAPRARVRLSDLARSGRRPLNLLRQEGDLVRVVLEAPAGVSALPAIELRLLW